MTHSLKWLSPTSRLASLARLACTLETPNLETMTEKFKAEQRVLYGDTDSMGVAYYANYLKWFEIGRTELFRREGSSYRSLEERGCFLPVYEAYCRYHNPARYDDVINIETTFSFAGKARFRFDYRLLRKPSGALLAEGYTVHVCTNKNGRVFKPPAYLNELLRNLEKVTAGSNKKRDERDRRDERDV